MGRIYNNEGDNYEHHNIIVGTSHSVSGAFSLEQSHIGSL